MFKTLLLLFICASVHAMPGKFEIWFLSPDTARSAVDNLKSEQILFSKLTAQALQCQPMGDYCFDPQVGMYKPGKDPRDEAMADYTEADKLEDYKYEAKALGKEQADFKCDKNNMFDIFCGKSKAIRKENAKFEVWVDISQSMKQIDFAGYDQICKRESFLRLLARDCSFNGEMRVHGFNESKKELGTFDSACFNTGLNSRDTMIKYIKESKAKHIVIITDIYEADETLLNFVEASGVGSVKGIDKPMFAGDLNTQAKSLSKKCL